MLAIDGSQQMLAQLRERLGQLDRVQVLQADLREPLQGAEPVDTMLSVATLHWLPDHAQVFRSVAGLLRPGGQFAAEAGAATSPVSATVLARSSAPTTGRASGISRGPETRERLAAAGFTSIEVGLVPDPARLESAEQLKAFLGTVILGAHLRDLPPAGRRPFVRAVAAPPAEAGGQLRPAADPRHPRRLIRRPARGRSAGLPLGGRPAAGLRGVPHNRSTTSGRVRSCHVVRAESVVRGGPLG